ncbi:hypothetical protein [Niabella hibiscisoli]|uniref:hypothetical protein n=1 Tax=Niabella hibiscisoli TaxID=1825928 RepID=UPI001F0E5988|nr:hypothetical protein [Niabella hibiscisoli]MCH5717106.1 hypothetical protein [Niabella hibiscisoli]
MKSPLSSYNPADFETVKQVALSFPETEESVSHEGTPSVKVRGKLMCRLHETGSFIPIRLSFEIRDQYLDSHPELFHLPEHFKNYPYICMWVHHYDIQLLKQVLTLSWRELATKKAIKAYDQAGNK